MKKLINSPDTVLAESLDGFAAAHADIVVLGEERKFVRRAKLEARQGGADLGRRLGPRAAACRLRRPRHARRRLPRPGLHLAHARPDDRRGGGGRRRRGRPLHRQELRGRRHELRHGRRDGRPRHHEGHHRRRRRGRGLDLVDRPARRRRHDDRREDRRRRGRGGRQPRRAARRSATGSTARRARWAWR